MNQFFNKIYLRHKSFWTPQIVRALILSLSCLGLALIIQQIASNYVASINGPVVGDLIVNHLPVWGINKYFVPATIISTITVALLLLIKPQYLVFTVKTLAIFVVIRSFFISLTHLGINPYQQNASPDNFGYTLYNFLYNFRGDFFFSGHTGIQVLLALIFWQEKNWRYFFLASAAIFGIAVLIGRLHYSIDVFAAPFIAHSIYTVAIRLFPQDFAYTKAS